jgi:hypothetical protein
MGVCVGRRVSGIVGERPKVDRWFEVHPPKLSVPPGRLIFTKGTGSAVPHKVRTDEGFSP